MRLRTKSAVLILSIAVVIVVLLEAFSSNIIMSGFADMERNSMLDNMQRAGNAVSQDVSVLDAMARDYARSNDTYAYAVGTNPGYVDMIVEYDTLSTLSIDLMLLYDSTGQYMHGFAENIDTDLIEPVPAEILANITPSSPLLQHTSIDSRIAGVMALSNSFLEVSSRPILTDQGEGPIAGTLIFARYLDQAEITRLSTITALTIGLTPSTNGTLTATLGTGGMGTLANGSVVVLPLNHDVVAAYALLPSVNDGADAVFSVEMPREIIWQGESMQFYALVSMSFLAVCFVLVTMLSFQGWVFARFKALNNGVEDIGRKKDFSARLDEKKKDEIGDIARNINAMLDELEKAQEQVAESEKRYRAVVENQTELIARMLPDGRLTFANAIFCRYFGRRGDLLLVGRTLADLLPAEEGARLLRDISSSATPAGKAFEQRLTRSDGQQRWIRISGLPIYDDNGTLAEIQFVGQDITERKAAEDELRLKAHLLDATNDMISLQELDGTIIYANEAMGAAHGYSREALIGMKIWNLRSSELSKPEDEIAKSFRERGYASFEAASVRKDGKRIPVELHSTIVQVAGKRYVLNVGRDITERKKAEQDVRKSEANYRAVVEDQTDLICRQKPDGTLTFVNGAFCRYYRKGAKEVLGTRFAPRIPDEDKRMIDSRMASMTPSRPVISIEHRVIMPDGETRWLECTRRAFFDNEGVITEIQSVGRDITESHKMENELVKTQKLESLGLLAGGIAHDFNNILASIVSNIALIKMDFDPEDPLHKRLEDVETAALGASELTRQLLTFAKGGTPVKEAVDIAELARHAVEFALRGTDVKGRFVFPDNLSLVEADPGQIEQVINNLVINAVQAMPKGGIITVSADNIMVHPETSLPLPVGDYVKFTVADQGTGIPKELVHKIFDPFFTTKTKGTGLGLTTSQSILKKHRGHIEVESELGVGSRFTIYLPAAPKGAERNGHRKDEKLVGSGRVLLMDDEEAILAVVSNLMMQMGYEVECARDGAEVILAYKRAKEEGRPFDAVIMDLTVRGGMGGMEAIRELLKIDPQVRAIVSSGYSNDPVMAEHENFGFRGVLQKPYSAAGLNRILRTVMSEKRSEAV
jgi:two-component system cell cycle sensor histidine kinase/response regulator CckA